MNSPISVCGCFFARVLVGQIRDKKVLKMIENAQSRLVRYVFDYNLLEAISIVVSTSILLVGMVCYRIPCMLKRASHLLRMSAPRRHDVDTSASPPTLLVSPNCRASRLLCVLV